MTCPKCGSKCGRRRAGEFYCKRHGDMPKSEPLETLPFIGPHPDIVMKRPIKAKGAGQ